MKKIITTLSVTLLLGACGGSSSGGDQAATADLFIKVASEQDLELDEGCVREQTDRLSDADAQAIVDAGVDGDPELSDAGTAITDDIFQCVDAESYIDGLVNSFSEGDEEVADCLRGELDGLSAVEVEDKIFDVAFDCALG